MSSPVLSLRLSVSPARESEGKTDKENLPPPSYSRKKVKIEDMVIAAMEEVKSGKSKTGISLKAIYKFITKRFQAVELTLATRRRIKIFLTKSLTNGRLINTKGKGLAGSFKLPLKEKRPTTKKLQGHDDKMKKPGPKKLEEGREQQKMSAKKAKDDGDRQKNSRKLKKILSQDTQNADSTIKVPKGQPKHNQTGGQ